ncbi:glycosyl hydrolase [Ensifer adhaerens]|uniref:glycoside hydrolase family 26 protein n=1 Tax=Ensifer adhaerens TaxID=106592 RepID=UPI0023A9B2BE|nr:glycosyl hydrolase [Ensifer adhaerens]WDZ75425.1 glycosyl hydrolase [Ensifer adhaerens]
MSARLLRSALVAGTLALVAAAGSPTARADDPADGIDRALMTAAISPPTKSARERAVVVGVYDPHDAVADSDALELEHVFVYWQKPDRALLKRKIAIAARQGRALMLSVEPYTHAADWRAGGERLFADIGNGRFDREIGDVCARAAAFDGPVYVRWGHEMEDPDGRYPWARRDKEGYKKAFRYFVAKCRALAPEARFVWSPKGHRNLAGYYPGDDVVDVIGIPVWGLQKMDVDYWGRERRFGEALSEKYRRVAGFGKPVMIAELGVSGSADYRRAWYREILDQQTYRRAFPLLTTVVFFNDKEPYKWPLRYGSPDWRLDKEALKALADRRTKEAAELDD